jgi:hypothetical protein
VLFGIEKVENFFAALLDVMSAIIELNLLYCCTIVLQDPKAQKDVDVEILHRLILKSNVRN